MIVLINPNSTDAMTKAMIETAKGVGVTVEGWTSHDGPPAIQGPEDGEACIPPLLALVGKASDQGAHAIIIGCFDDTGLEQARSIAHCPVIGIGQAAYHMAALAGARFSVVTTLEVSVPVLEENIHRYGLGGQLARVRASGVPVLDLETDPDAASAKVRAEIELAAAEDRIDSVVLGCAGMSRIASGYDAGPPLRLIDGVRSAAQMAAALTSSGIIDRPS